MGEIYLQLGGDHLTALNSFSREAGGKSQVRSATIDFSKSGEFGLHKIWGGLCQYDTLCLRVQPQEDLQQVEEGIPRVAFFYIFDVVWGR